MLMSRAALLDATKLLAARAEPEVGGAPAGRQAILCAQVVLQAAPLDRMSKLPALHDRVAPGEVQGQLRRRRHHARGVSGRHAGRWEAGSRAKMITFGCEQRQRADRSLPLLCCTLNCASALGPLAASNGLCSFAALLSPAPHDAH